MFAVVTDTSANLDCEIMEKNRITAIPFSFYMDGLERTCVDTRIFDGKAYYDAMRGGTKVTTSQVTPQRYVDYMQPLLESGSDILFVGMSSGVSGSFDAVRMAAVQLKTEFPERNIALVDTLGASLGEGLLVLQAVKCRDDGMSLETTAEYITKTRQSMCQVFTVDDLKYLRETGRLSNFQAVVASVLHIKPLLKGDEEGKIVCFAKVRGRRKSIEALAAQYDAMVHTPDEQMVGIAHADCPEEAQLLAQLVCRNKPPKDIFTVCYEPVTGAHVGPGTLALFFLGDEKFRGRNH